ncbi:MAG: tRNA (adenosine(37)-N6)-threonylcarbamoyltransferase complex ATPase subunit type 1 TsaE [Magnetococcales bacterium]|nr:tRNA (adenosine(37)-N6)-threonylcarbamoyltransferase complex ATPase subunit type 1 TsaE [Magnetococcales bacterium]
MIPPPLHPRPVQAREDPLAFEIAPSTRQPAHGGGHAPSHPAPPALEIVRESPSPEATTALAESLAKVLAKILAEVPVAAPGAGVSRGILIALEGDLGAGKTLFARGLIRGLGVTDPYITSPTFTLMNLYEPPGMGPLRHFDLYRLSHPEELAQLGVEESFDDGGVTLVEWPERGGEWLPGERLTVRLEIPVADSDRRRLVLRAADHGHRAILAAWGELLDVR